MGLGEFYSLACALAWAIAVVLFKKSGESLAPFALNLFKNVLVLPLFLLTIWVVQGLSWPNLRWDHLLLILFSGFLGIAAGDTLYLRALNSIGASRMAVAQTLYSPFVIGLSTLFLAERLNIWQLCGVVLVLGGIVMVTYAPGHSQLDARVLLKGVIWAGFSVLLMAIGVVIAKPMLEQHDFLWVVTLRIVGGLAGMLVIVLVRGNARQLLAAYGRVRHWPQVIAGGFVGTYISMMVWLAGYKYTEASVAAVLNELAAVFILLLAVVFLKERVTKRQVAGAVLAMGGVVLVVSG